MKKKLAAVVVLIALAIAVLGSGALYAYFYTTQTATGNQFTAGTIKLSINNGSTAQILANNIVPSSTIYTPAAGWPIIASGSIGGNLNISTGAVTNKPTGTDMGASLILALWVDADNNGVWSNGDYYLASNGNTWAYNASNSAAMIGGVPQAAYSTLDSYTNVTWPNVKTNIAPGSNAGTFRAVYNLPYNAPNNLQGASGTFNIMFSLQQYQT